MLFVKKLQKNMERVIRLIKVQGQYKDLFSVKKSFDRNGALPKIVWIFEETPLP